MDPNDCTMYAKRSLCFQRMNDKGSAMADAKAYRDMRQDLPEPCSEEEGAALKLVEVRCVVLCCVVVLLCCCAVLYCVVVGWRRADTKKRRDGGGYK